MGERYVLRLVAVDDEEMDLAEIDEYPLSFAPGREAVAEWTFADGGSVKRVSLFSVTTVVAGETDQ